MAAFKGITRVRRNGREVEGSVYLARLTVPLDVRRIAESLPGDDPRRGLFIGPTGKAKAELLESTGHVDPRDAMRVAGPTITRWKAAIAGLRQGGNPEIVGDVLDRIGQWQADEVARAQGFGVEAALYEYTARLRSDGSTEAPAPGIEIGGVEWANAYFKSRPDASREIEMPDATFNLLDRLDACESGPERWRDIDGFDAHLEREVGVLDPKVRASIRTAFARAWRAVAAAHEVERRHAAALLKIVGEARATTVALPPIPGYVPRRGDRTVGELLDAYQAAKPSKDIVAPARAVREFLGEHTPVRAVTRPDARRFADFVGTIPSNATKRYPGKTFLEAVAAAQRDGGALLSPVSAAQYVSYASGFWNFGLKEGDGSWADFNPFVGLARSGEPSIRRRGFNDKELGAFFRALEPYKASDAALFWVPAVLLNGARLSEVCQLRVDDVRFHDGIPYVDVGLYDAKGRRDPLKSLKKPWTARTAPLHPVTIRAGFLEFVARRQAEGCERLFGDITPLVKKADPTRPGEGDDYDWGHYLSRDLNAVIDKVVGDDPALVVHSLRHGCRERLEDADVSEAIIDACLGWKQRTVGRKYGVRDIALLSKNLARLSYGSLAL